MSDCRDNGDGRVAVLVYCDKTGPAINDGGGYWVSLKPGCEVGINS